MNKGKGKKTNSYLAAALGLVDDFQGKLSSRGPEQTRRN